MEEKEQQMYFDYTHFEKIITWKKNTYCIQLAFKKYYVF